MSTLTAILVLIIGAGLSRGIYLALEWMWPMQWPALSEDEEAYGDVPNVEGR